MKSLRMLGIATAIALSVNSVHAIIPVQETEYVFVETGGTAGFSGALFLDSSSSTGGSLSDINMSQSYIDTPDFDFTLNQAMNLVSTPTFAWNSSAITSMDITGEFIDGLDTESFTLTPTEISEVTVVNMNPLDPMGAGNWTNSVNITAVPDTASTALMFGIVGACFAPVRRYFARNRRG